MMSGEEKRADAMKQSIHYCIATEGHKKLIMNFMLEHFRVEEPITSAVGMLLKATISPHDEVSALIKRKYTIC